MEKMFNVENIVAASPTQARFGPQALAKPTIRHF
jgi:hypothetical protein